MEEDIRQTTAPSPEDGTVGPDAAPAEPPLTHPQPATQETPAADLYEGRYSIGPILGKGGTCCVYRAWDTQLQRYVALKRLEPPLSEDEHIRARFYREGRAIARLSHPNVVTLIDRGSTETEEYLVFEYVEGRSLKDLIKTEGPLDPKRAGQIAGQIAEGLAHVHLTGLVHRDVKPQNILLDSEDRARITDFGIAIGPDWTRVTRVGAIVGSSRYMSPEQIQSRPIDGRSDIYSLGLVFYEMLAGKPAFDGTTLAEIGRKHLREKPEPLSALRPDLPPGVERVVLRCLEKLPENRFQSMDEFLGALVGLSLYEPRRTSGGLLDFLLGGREDSLGDSETWIPPKETLVPPPPGVRRSDRRHLARSRRRHVGQRQKRILTAVGVIIALGVIGVVLGLTLSRPAAAPDLLGLTLDQAKDVAAESGYRVEVERQVVAIDATAGVVTVQDPTAGAVTGENTIMVVVTREPTSVKIARLMDVDPEGDGEENPDLLPALIDGKTDTAWSTEVYKSSDFNGIKQGVGVAFDLDRPATVMRIVSSGDRWRGLLLAVDESGGDLKEIAALGGSTDMTVELPRPVRSGRIWITKLDKTENGAFQVGIFELAFYQ